MGAIPLLGGAYSTRSAIANAQRCVNLFPEKNQEQGEVPVTQYQTPGLTVLVAGPLQTAWRGLFLASNGVLYGVLDTNVYRVETNFVLTLLGTIPSGQTLVSMADNGTELVLVNGSTTGWHVTLATNAFAQISDPDFVGGDFIGYLDTFLVYNQPNTRNFFASDSNSITFDPLSFDAKTGYPDKLVALKVNHVEIWLIGAETTEIWSNVGSVGFPFQRVQGAFIQHGCAAKYSVASYDLQLFWLSQDNNGQALVLMGTNYQVRPISNAAVSFALAQYTTISDAIGFVYQQGTHIFYVLSFPTENKTWAYDASTNEWHERVFTDQNGRENRHRANVAAFAYGKTVVGDWQNGLLYALDLNNFTDNGLPIVRRRGFPHVTTDGKLAFHQQFMANIEVGTIVAGKGNLTEFDQNPDPAAPERTPLLNLRWSDTKGVTFGDPVEVSLGASGEYETRPSWRDLGQSADRVYELFWSEDCAVALNGAYLDAIPLPI